jgi:eukaryotic-like serine/threonine-protein kinase
VALEVGTVIDDKYRIERLLGTGGMGSVYLAVHTELDRPFALKVLHGGRDDEGGVLRFKREARAAGRIGNEHILEIFDIGRTGNGEHYMVMEYLRGEPLRTRLERVGTLSEESFLHIAPQLLDGLGAAHQAGIVHRDLKPDNIILLERRFDIPDFVKIIDFGVARFREIDSNSGSLTKTGTVLGTPYYLSPEQAGGKTDLDSRSDIHTVGTIFYQCLSGRLPFQHTRDMRELLIAIMVHEPPSLLEVAPDVDPELAAIVMRAMANRPEARYQTTHEFADALRNWMGSGGIGRFTASGSPVIGQSSSDDPIRTLSQPLAVGSSQASNQPTGSRPSEVPSEAAVSSAAAALPGTSARPPDNLATTAVQLVTNTQPSVGLGGRGSLLLAMAAILAVGGGVVGASVALSTSSDGSTGTSGQPAPSEAEAAAVPLSASAEEDAVEQAVAPSGRSAPSASAVPSAATAPEPRRAPQASSRRPAPATKLPKPRSHSRSPAGKAGEKKPASPSERETWDPY